MKKTLFALIILLLIIVGYLGYRNYALKKQMLLHKNSLRALADETRYLLAAENQRIEYEFFTNMAMSRSRYKSLYSWDSVAKSHTDSLLLAIDKIKDNSELKIINSRERTYYQNILKKARTNSQWPMENLNDIFESAATENNDISLSKILLKTRYRLIKNYLSRTLINEGASFDYRFKQPCILCSPILRLGKTYRVQAAMADFAIPEPHILKVDGKKTPCINYFSIIPKDTGLHELKAEIDFLLPGEEVFKKQVSTTYYVLPK